MYQIQNKTPFTCGLTPFSDKNGLESISVVVKGTFCIFSDDKEPCLATEQLPVLFTNEYYGIHAQSSIKYPVDVVPDKQTTDLLFVGNAYSTNGVPTTKLYVSLGVGRLKKTIQISGDRQWCKTLLNYYDISNAIPFVKLPIVYERSFGGCEPSSRDLGNVQRDSRNPVGTGFCMKKKQLNGIALPNIEYPLSMIRSWKDRPPVAGLGAIDCHWEPRTQYMGTYDQEWLENQFPLLPNDFNSLFYNMAPSDQMTPSYIVGGERVELLNLSKISPLIFYLPKLEIRLTCFIGGRQKKKTGKIWTVVFEPDEERYYLVWGTSFEIGKQPSLVSHVVVETDFINNLTNSV